MCQNRAFADQCLMTGSDVKLIKVKCVFKVFL